MTLLDLLLKRFFRKERQIEKCPNCGATVTLDMERCPKCGVHISSMFKKKCPKCGELNEINAERCKKCKYDFAVELLKAKKKVYVCPICGYKASFFMTRCPACGTRFV